MKKIVIISTGSFTHIQPYIDFYKQQGHEVFFVAITPSRDRGVESVTLLKKNVTRSRLGKLLYFWAGYKARAVIKRVKPDFIHAHYATSGGVVSWLSARKIPFILTAHGSDILTNKNSRLWRLLFNRILNKADKINVVSDEIEETLTDWGVNSEKIITACLGIDTKKFIRKEPIGIRAKSLRLISTRSFESIYDNETIIRALKRLKKNGVDFKMTFVGGGSLLEDCLQMVKDYELVEYVDFVGKVNNSRLPEILNQHDFYISASLSDGTSLCLLEAMACGLIPIVSKIRANRDWIETGKNGLLFQTGSDYSLFEKIVEASSFSESQRQHIATYNIMSVKSKGDRSLNLGVLTL